MWQSCIGRKAQPALKNGSVILTDFYNNSLSTNREGFVAIESDVSEGNINQSTNRIAALSVQDNLDANYKAFYEVLVKHNTDSVLSATDSLSLTGIANMCPFTQGAVVYQARALYNIAFSRADIFEDNCPVATNSSRLAQTQGTTAIDHEGFDAMVYPNPASGNIFIAPIGADINIINIVVTDISGKEVYNNHLNVQNGYSNLDLELNNGTYFIKVIDLKTHESVIKKMISQK